MINSYFTCSLNLVLQNSIYQTLKSRLKPFWSLCHLHASCEDITSKWVGFLSLNRYNFQKRKQLVSQWVFFLSKRLVISLWPLAIFEQAFNLWHYSSIRNIIRWSLYPLLGLSFFRMGRIGGQNDPPLESYQ